MIYFPVAYNVVVLLAVSILYAISAEHVADPEVLNTVIYLGVVITHWSLFYVIVRRLGIGGIKEIIVPKKKMRWPNSILVFVALNVLFKSYMVLALAYARILSWGT